MSTSGVYLGLLSHVLDRAVWSQGRPVYCRPVNFVSCDPPTCRSYKRQKLTVARTDWWLNAGISCPRYLTYTRVATNIPCACLIQTQSLWPTVAANAKCEIRLSVVLVAPRMSARKQHILRWNEPLLIASYTNKTMSSTPILKTKSAHSVIIAFDRNAVKTAIYEQFSDKHRKITRVKNWELKTQKRRHM